MLEARLTKVEAACAIAGGADMNHPTFLQNVAMLEDYAASFPGALLVGVVGRHVRHDVFIL